MATTKKAVTHKAVVIEAEIIPDAQDVKQENLPAVLTPEQKAKQEVARYDIARKWIATKKKEYLALKINGPDDKENYKIVEKAWQEIRGKRLQVAKTHKTIKEDYLIITRAVDGEKNELTELLQEIETPLNAELERIDNIKKEEAERVEREAQEKLQGRVATLLENGMAFTGSYYTIGETVSMDVVTLKGLKDEEFSKLLETVQTAKKVIDDAAAEVERKAQEERDALQKQKDDQETERLRLQNLADELKKQQDEMDLLKKQAKETLKKLRAELKTAQKAL